MLDQLVAREVRRRTVRPQPNAEAAEEGQIGRYALTGRAVRASDIESLAP